MGSCCSADDQPYDPYKIPAPERPPPQATNDPPPAVPQQPREIRVEPLPDKPRPFSPSSAAPSILHPVKNLPTQSFAQNYIRDIDLGHGAFAEVFVGIHKASGHCYAVKKIDRSKMFWSDRDALVDEISNLTEVREGPNIVQLYEVYQQETDCYLVLEWMQGGELFERILKKRTFTEKEARDVCRCMLSALEYMHEKRVAHRDLKPENLLLASKESDTEIKLADFGFAKKVTTDKGCRTLCGTPGYLAPEVLERWPSYDTKCDLWSTGVILFLLLGGYLPFDETEEAKIFDRTRNGQYEFYPDYWKNVSASAKNLVISLLTVNPSKRVSATVALDHQWMKDQALEVRRLSVDTLQHTIMAERDGKTKMKAAVKAIMVGDRMRKLNDDFDLYLKKHDDSKTVFSDAVKMAQAAERPKPEDSASGLPFDHFYEVGDVLGEGGFGVVRRATHKTTKDTKAVKIIDRTKLPTGADKALQDEIMALKLLRGGPHIVRLFDVFNGKKKTYLVMEEMKGGELLRRIVDKEVYTEREAMAVCKILFSAVDYCHKKKIAHRDLKPENLLLTELNDDTSIKIADFGFAKKVTKPNCLSTLCGTASYVAPEVLDMTAKGYDQRADMWSVGVIVYILLGGYAPFEGPVEELANVILRGEYEFHDKYWKYTSSDAKDLITSLLMVNPNLRATAEDALQSDWMTTDAETLTGNDLSVAQEKLRKSLPIQKLKGAVHTVILSNKFNSLSDSFTSILGDADAIKKIQENRGGCRESLAPIDEVSPGAIEDSSSGRPFDTLYDLGAPVGSGTFSVVLEAVHKQSHGEFAVKCVDRRDLHPSDAVALQDEIIALRAVVDCPHIVHLHDVFEEPDTTYLVLERMRGGDLIERIISRAHYTEADAREVCKNLLLGVQFCHGKKIANRNLKPENIFLTSESSDTDVKISDFGYAKKVLYENSLRTQCGTEGYVAPEILEHRPAYGVKCDMWSLGVILYILLGGYRPFRGSGDEVMRQIRYGEYKFHQRYWKGISAEAKDLIRRMMTVDPEKRITASEALESAWILTDGSELQSDLSESQNELKTFKGKEKLRQVVQTIIATRKLQTLGAQYRAFEDF